MGAAGFGAPDVAVGVVVAAGFAGWPFAGAAGLAGDPVPEADAVSPGVVGVGALADAGSVVKGVGSPGIGFARIPAIN